MVALFVTAALRSTPWWFIAAAVTIPALHLLSTSLRSADPLALRHLRALVGAEQPQPAVELVSLARAS